MDPVKGPHAPFTPLSFLKGSHALQSGLTSLPAPAVCCQPAREGPSSSPVTDSGEGPKAATPTPQTQGLLRDVLGGSAVKKPPAIQETQVQSLGREDPLEAWQPILVFLH